MNYITIADRVVVEPDPDSETTSAGFVIAYDDTPNCLGTVLLTGPGRVSKKNVTIPMDLKAGDRVMFIKGTGIAVTVDGRNLLLFKEDELIGTLE
jgi:chaperonin GroES